MIVAMCALLLDFLVVTTSFQETEIFSQPWNINNIITAEIVVSSGVSRNSGALEKISRGPLSFPSLILPHPSSLRGFHLNFHARARIKIRLHHIRISEVTTNKNSVGSLWIFWTRVWVATRMRHIHFLRLSNGP